MEIKQSDFNPQAPGTPAAVTVGAFSSLPVDVIMEILRLLSPKDLCKIPLLNRTFQKLIADYDMQLWKPILCQYSVLEVNNTVDKTTRYYFETAKKLVEQRLIAASTRIVGISFVEENDYTPHFPYMGGLRSSAFL